jgi:hypothetical protein
LQTLAEVKRTGEAAMKILYQIAPVKFWLLVIRLSVAMPDQSLPPGTQLLLSLIAIIDVGYRLLIDRPYRRRVLDLLNRGY